MKQTGAIARPPWFDAISLQRICCATTPRTELDSDGTGGALVLEKQPCRGRESDRRRRAAEFVTDQAIRQLNCGLFTLTATARKRPAKRRERFEKYLQRKRAGTGNANPAKSPLKCPKMPASAPGMSE